MSKQVNSLGWVFGDKVFGARIEKVEVRDWQNNLRVTYAVSMYRNGEPVIRVSKKTLQDAESLAENFRRETVAK
jgi:hypothetical protein